MKNYVVQTFYIVNEYGSDWVSKELPTRREAVKKALALAKEYPGTVYAVLKLVDAYVQEVLPVKVNILGVNEHRPTNKE